MILQAAHPGSRERIEWESIVVDKEASAFFFFKRKTSSQPLRLDSGADGRSR